MVPSPGGLLHRIGHRQRRQQPADVRIAGLPEHLGVSPGLDELAMIQNRDLIGQHVDHREVVANEKGCESEFVAKLKKQLQYLGLHRDVECAGGLVGNE